MKVCQGVRVSECQSVKLSECQSVRLSECRECQIVESVRLSDGQSVESVRVGVKSGCAISHVRVGTCTPVLQHRQRLTFFVQHRRLSKHNVFLPHQQRQCFHKFTPHQFGHTNEFATFRISAVEQDTILAHQQNVRRKGFGPFVFVVLFEIPRDGACSGETRREKSKSREVEKLRGK